MFENQQDTSESNSERVKDINSESEQNICRGNNKTKKAIVTGGAGFIGSHLVDGLINDGWIVDIIDDMSTGRYENINPKRRILLKHDISNPIPVEWFKDIDVVFHLAGKADLIPSIENPMEYYNTNATGTMNVMEACRIAGVKRVVYAASSSRFGDNKSGIMDEYEEIDPKHPYALTKVIGEEIVENYREVYKIDATRLILFNVYGRRSRTSGAYGAVIGTFMKQFLCNEPLTIVGDGSQVRDFIHVSDVVDAFIKCVINKSSNMYVVGSGEAKSINELAELISDNVEYIPDRPNEPKYISAYTKLIENELSWHPKVSFEEGIQEILDHPEDYDDAPLWTKESIADATRTWFDTLGTVQE